MNNELLLKLSPFSNIQEGIKPWNRIINALDSDDVIGTVLRLHLMCEQALEARICLDGARFPTRAFLFLSAHYDACAINKILSKTSQISTALFFILRSGSQKCGHFLVRFFLFSKIRPLIDSTRV
ncbi:hypothetical protein [Aggregatibacter aphrophilus]|jgi:hypothetical protein|uniref:hypothetical protein n=1 Tax=Aggregatibacter aphrophilus TaxID=732 RepID=UPI0009F7313B|nr:hypothetical protein [Aggregatibacter aphrophilus]